MHNECDKARDYHADTKHPRDPINHHDAILSSCLIYDTSIKAHRKPLWGAKTPNAGYFPVKITHVWIYRYFLRALINFFDEQRCDLMNITDDSKICNLEEWRICVVVDNDNFLRCLHA